MPTPAPEEVAPELTAVIWESAAPGSVLATCGVDRWSWQLQRDGAVVASGGGNDLDVLHAHLTDFAPGALTTTQTGPSGLEAALLMMNGTVTDAAGD